MWLFQHLLKTGFSVKSMAQIQPPTTAIMPDGVPFGSLCPFEVHINLTSGARPDSVKSGLIYALSDAFNATSQAAT